MIQELEISRYKEIPEQPLSGSYIFLISNSNERGGSGLDGDFWC